MASLNKDLRQEIATVAKDIAQPTYGGILRPQDDTLLTRGQGKGLKIYEDLLRDPHAFSVIQKRKMALVSQEWDVFPAKDGGRAGKKAAELVKRQLSSFRFNRLTLGLLDAILKGFAVGEIIWQAEGQEVIAKQVKIKNQRRFTFIEANQEGLDYELRLLTFNNFFEGEALPQRKFIVHSFGSSDDNPFGLGLGTRLFWPVFFKRQDITFWLTFVDKFASPTMLGKYPVNASVEDQRKLLEALGAIAHDSGVIIPDGMLIELLEAARSSSIDSYERLARFMDEQISEAVLGETLTTNVGSVGSLAAGKVHNEVRLELIKADADLLSDTLNNSLVRWIVELNMPDAPLPKLWWNFEESEDLNSRVERDKKIFEMGYRPTLKYIQETYGGEWEDTQVQQQEANAPVTDEQFLANSRLTAPVEAEPQPEFAEDDSPADSYTERGLKAIRKQTTQMINQIKSLIEEVEFDSLANLSDRLLESYSAIDSTGFGESLSQAMLAAELAGRWEVAQGQEAEAVSASVAEAVIHWMESTGTTVFQLQEFRELGLSLTSDAKETETASFTETVINWIESTGTTVFQLQEFRELGLSLTSDAMNFSEIEPKDYERIGQKFVEILLANLDRLDFAETKKLSDPEILLDLKRLLETQYLDGLTALTAFIDETNITGIFEDKVSEQLTKRYTFKISNEAISYKLLNTNQSEEADFSEDDLNFAEKKGKTCVKGTRCGSTCISASKTCRLGMTTEQKKTYDSIVTKAKAVDSQKTPQKGGKKSKTSGAGIQEQDQKIHAIKSQESFENVALNVFEDLNSQGNHGGLVPIYQLRRKIGETVERDKFNDFLKEMQSKDLIQLQSGSVEDSAPDKIRDSITTELDGLRAYVKLSPEGLAQLEKAKASKSDVDKLLNNRPELDPVGSASKLSKGPKISSQQEFNKVIEDAYNRLNKEFNYDNNVPIHQLRKALGKRVSQEEFDDYIYDKFTPKNNKYATDEENDNGLVDAFGDKKTHVTRDRR